MLCRENLTLMMADDERFNGGEEGGVRMMLGFRGFGDVEKTMMKP